MSNIENRIKKLVFEFIKSHEEEINSNKFKVVLPEGIYTIWTHSFYGSQINELYLPHSLIEILDFGFKDAEINRIIYNGTKDEFYAIKGRYVGYLDAAQIECKDGNIVNENY